MSQETTGIFQFAEFQVDALARTLRRQEAIITLNRRAFDVLLYFVQNPGRVLPRDELLKNVWPETYVDEGSLAQSISVLRRALEEKPGDNSYIVTLPGRGYQFVSPVKFAAPESLSNIMDVATAASIPSRELPFPQHMVGTSAVTQRDEREGSSIPLRRPSARFIAALILGALLVGGCVSWFALRPAARAKPRKVMLAVLPFMNLTGDPGQEYISDGLTEEMIAQLGEMNHAELGIIARTSAMTYKGTTKSVTQIGRELGVDYVLEGSIRRWGERVRISAQLIKTADQTHIWAENYESDVHDILKLQSEVAEAIAGRIDLALTPQQKARAQIVPRVDPRVYELYLLGRYEWNKRTEAGLNQAIAYFQQAINSDPKYAPAYAGMAQAYVLLPYYGGALADEAASKAKSFAEEALRLDDTMVEAHTALGFVAVGHFDWPTARMEYRRALQLNSNYATARQWYSFYLWITKGHDEALVELDRARQLDPLSLIINTDQGRLLCASQQTDRAISLLEETITLEPNFADAHRALALAYIQKGRVSDAVSEARRGVALDPNDYEQATLGYVYAVAGKPEQARKILVELSDHAHRRRVSPVYLSFIHVGLRETNQAFARLEEAYRDRSSLLALMQFETIFDPIRNDPRFSRLWQRVAEGHAQ